MHSGTKTVKSACYICFRMRYEVLSFLLLPIMIHNSHSYRFLGLFPLPIKSHFYVFEKLMKGLASKGHQVDVLTHFPQEKPVPRYNDISIAGTLPSLENNVSIKDTLNMGAWDVAAHMFKQYGSDVCEKVLKHPELKKLKTTKVKYDAIVTEVFGTDCLLGFAYLFKVPVIGVISTMHLPWGNERIGNPDNPSYVTNYFIPRKGKMILLHKIEIVLATLLSKFGYHLMSTIPSEMIAREFFGNEMPPLDYLAFNTSLLLVNSNFLINDPKPTVPGFIEIGGMHIEKPKPLPSNLTAVVNMAENGIIYFSMGTLMQMDTFPKEELKSIMDAFALLPQTVLWKGRSKHFSKSLPKNIVIAEWFPQLDILCHPKTKLFITHGGQLSMLEALYCGVPILGMPIVADQDLNVLNYEMHGAGMRLDFPSISKQNVLDAVRNLLHNDSYRRNARHLSRLFKDRPTDFADNAVFWTEYVVRNNGAPHLRTAGADLIWFEYYLIDVLLVFLALFALMGMAFLVMLNIVQNYFDNPRYSYGKEKQK